LVDPEPGRRRKFPAGAVHLRQIGPAPQVSAPKRRRNPGNFHIAVWDLVGRSETSIGAGRREPRWRKRQRRWSKALVRHGADVGAALAEVPGVSAGDIRGEGPAQVGDPLRALDPEAALRDDCGEGQAGWKGDLRQGQGEWRGRADNPCP
jgi:hypothetical protein